ncbi:MAG TPA: hypothetical protein VGB03_05200 [Acidimicrobiales bacterium]|jgi:hypothetical protein
MDFDDHIKRHLHEEAATVNADNSLLDDLKRRAGGRRRRRQLMLAGAGVAAAAAVAFGVVLAQDDKPAETGVVAPGPNSTESPPLTGTSSTAPTSSTSSTVAMPKNDWDNVRFDAGVVKQLRQVGDQWLLTFDRIQVDGKSAADFTDEPILCCHTDAMTTNDNPALRTYYVSAGAEVLELANRPFTCPGPDEEGYNKDPRWEPRKLADMARTTKWDQWDGVSLTFDPKGNVIRIRLGGGC